jgi:epoxide hydrolase-like predicted phosphatase
VAIRAVVFDIGGILEVIPEGGDPTSRFPQMMARWETRLGMEPGELDRRLTEMGERFRSMGKDGGDGTLSEAEWFEEVRLATGWDQTQMEAFKQDFWDTYCGNPNPELATYFAGLRPRYKAAFLSNSFDGARREEERRFHLSELADLIIYSHEVGVSKPDPRIYAITCERLDVQPSEMIFLDDSPGHIAAARTFGIHGVVFQNNAQAIGEIEALLAAHAV